MEATRGLGFRVNIGIMQKKMETITVYWGFIGGFTGVL